MNCQFNILVWVLPILLNPGSTLADDTSASADQSRLPGFPIKSIRGLDGAQLSLEAPSDGALALVFLWTECPVSNQYIPTLNALREQFEGKPVRLVGLFVDYKTPIEEIAAHADEYQVEFPTARLDSADLPQEIGVEIVPTALVVDDQRQVQYLGRIDDLFFDRRPESPGNSVGKRQRIRVEDLRDAIEAILKGETIAEPRTRAIGCTLPVF